MNRICSNPPPSRPLGTNNLRENQKNTQTKTNKTKTFSNLCSQMLPGMALARAWFWFCQGGSRPVPWEYLGSAWAHLGPLVEYLWSTWGVPGECLGPPGPTCGVPVEYLGSTWKILKEYLRNTWKVPEEYLESAWEVHGAYLKTTW